MKSPSSDRSFQPKPLPSRKPVSQTQRSSLARPISLTHGSHRLKQSSRSMAMQSAILLRNSITST
jgi:hypothetical protein